ncbi:MAG TPA: HAD-IA family hydrolase [Blastocatellia bacterium]|nr:HAD-IA family hydrolase [Blastocatellia bacterium]
MKIDCLIFDFDGTLVSSEHAYREAFQHSVRRHTGLDVNGNELTNAWSTTPREILRRYSEELLDEMVASFEEHYYANHHRLILYDGIAEVLEHLTHRGAHIAVVSLKPRRAGERELDITGLRNLIRASIWGDDVARPKPEPDGVLLALGELRVEAGRALVVGDSPADIMMGRSAGTKTAAALWGGAIRESLLAHSPDVALDRPGDLISFLNAEF